uniref:Uncharacterized protein n=1 Tax=Anguilla anguilla TaxID=7936 RepID=A0A0E9T769_ANGAN
MIFRHLLDHPIKCQNINISDVPNVSDRNFFLRNNHELKKPDN